MSRLSKIYRYVRDNWLILAIFIFALFIRTYRLQRPLSGSDEPYEILHFLRLGKTTFFKILPFAGNFFAQLFSYTHGFVNLLIGFFWSCMLSFFKIPLTEANLFMPFALFGSLSVIILYLVGKNLFNKSVGLIAAVFLAISPVSVMLSRGTFWMTYAVFFQLATILAFYKYFLEKKLVYAILGSVFFTLEIGCNNTFPLTLLVLIGLGVLTAGKGLVGKGMLGRFKKVCAMLFKKEIVLLPAFVVLMYSATSFFIILVKKSTGFFQHLSSRPWQIGFYGTNIWRNVVHVFGPLFSLLIALIFVFRVKKIWQDKVKIFLVFWILIYLVPFLFLIKDMESSHLLFIAAPVFLLVSAILVDVKRLRFTSIFLVIVFLVGLGILTLGGIFHIDPLVLKSFPEYAGRVGKGDSNRGFKTAGFYIREYTEPESKVFVPAEVYEIGFVSEFYLGKQILPGRFDKKSLYLTRAELGDNLADYYLMLEETEILSPEKQKVRQDLIKHMKNKRLIKVAEIRDGDELLMTIYSPNPAPLRILDVKIFDRLFDMKYANIRNLATNFYQGGFEL